MAILHFQRFGINVDDWPEPNEDGTYPNDDEDLCEPVAGDYCQDYCGK